MVSTVSYICKSKQKVISNIFALLTKSEVKIARYWPTSFFKKRKNKNKQNKRGEYSVILVEL